MTSTFEQRLALERRFLACVFAYPRTLEIDSHCFLAPEHGVIFDAIQQMEREFPAPTAAPATTYDDIALELVVALAADRARAIRASFSSANKAGAESGLQFMSADFARFVRVYMLEAIVPLPADADVIENLAAVVRQCPRCGR